MKKFYIYYVKINEAKTGVIKEYIEHYEANDLDEAIDFFYNEYSSKEYEVTGYDEIKSDGTKRVLKI